MPLPLVLIFPLETLSAQPGAELFRRHDLPGNRKRLTLEFRCKVLTVRFTRSRCRNNGTVSVNAFHEKAGRSQVDSFLLGKVLVFLSAESPL